MLATLEDSEGLRIWRNRLLSPPTVCLRSYIIVKGLPDCKLIVFAINGLKKISCICIFPKVPVFLIPCLLQLPPLPFKKVKNDLKTPTT